MAKNTAKLVKTTPVIDSYYKCSRIGYLYELTKPLEYELKRWRNGEIHKEQKCTYFITIIRTLSLNLGGEITARIEFYAEKIARFDPIQYEKTDDITDIIVISEDDYDTIKTLSNKDILSKLNYKIQKETK